MRERSVVEPRTPTGVSKALNAAWIRPFLFLIFIVVAWDLTIRLFGIPVAMLIAGSKTVESYVYPLLVFSQSVPKIAIAPLFVVWFGFGIIPKVISTFLLGF